MAFKTLQLIFKKYKLSETKLKYKLSETKLSKAI